MLCEEGGGYFLLEMTTQSKGGALGVAKEERRDIYAISSDENEEDNVDLGFRGCVLILLMVSPL